MKSCEKKWINNNEKKSGKQISAIPQPPIKFHHIIRDQNLLMQMKLEEIEEYNKLAMQQLSNTIILKCDTCLRQFTEDKYKTHILNCTNSQKQLKNSKSKGYSNQVELDNHQIVQIFAPGPQRTTEIRQSTQSEFDLDQIEEEQPVFKMASDQNSNNDQNSSINFGNCINGVNEIHNISQIEPNDEEAAYVEAYGSFEIEDYMINDMNNFKNDISSLAKTRQSLESVNNLRNQSRKNWEKQTEPQIGLQVIKCQTDQSRQSSPDEYQQINSQNKKSQNSPEIKAQVRGVQPQFVAQVADRSPAQPSQRPKAKKQNQQQQYKSPVYRESYNDEQLLQFDESCKAARDRVQCEYCQRRFAIDRIEKHQQICQKHQLKKDSYMEEEKEVITFQSRSEVQSILNSQEKSSRISQIKEKYCKQQSDNEEQPSSFRKINFLSSQDEIKVIALHKRPKRDRSHYEQDLGEINKAISSAKFTIDSITSKVFRFREASLKKNSTIEGNETLTDLALKSRNSFVIGQDKPSLIQSQQQLGASGNPILILNNDDESNQVDSKGASTTTNKSKMFSQVINEKIGIVSCNIADQESNHSQIQDEEKLDKQHMRVKSLIASRDEYGQNETYKSKNVQIKTFQSRENDIDKLITQQNELQVKNFQITQPQQDNQLLQQQQVQQQVKSNSQIGFAPLSKQYMPTTSSTLINSKNKVIKNTVKQKTVNLVMGSGSSSQNKSSSQLFNQNQISTPKAILTSDLIGISLSLSNRKSVLTVQKSSSQNRSLSNSKLYQSQSNKLQTSVTNNITIVNKNSSTKRQDNNNNNNNNANDSKDNYVLTTKSQSQKQNLEISMSKDQQKTLTQSDSKNALRNQLNLMDKGIDYLNLNKNKVISVNIQDTNIITKNGSTSQLRSLSSHRKSSVNNQLQHNSSQKHLQESNRPITTKINTVTNNQNFDSQTLQKQQLQPKLQAQSFFSSPDKTLKSKQIIQPKQSQKPEVFIIKKQVQSTNNNNNNIKEQIQQQQNQQQNQSQKVENAIIHHNTQSGQSSQNNSIMVGSKQKTIQQSTSVQKKSDSNYDSIKNNQQLTKNEIIKDQKPKSDRNNVIQFVQKSDQQKQQLQNFTSTLNNQIPIKQQSTQDQNQKFKSNIIQQNKTFKEDTLAFNTYYNQQQQPLQNNKESQQYQTNQALQSQKDKVSQQQKTAKNNINMQNSGTVNSNIGMVLSKKNSTQQQTSLSTQQQQNYPQVLLIKPQQTQNQQQQQQSKQQQFTNLQNHNSNVIVNQQHIINLNNNNKVKDKKLINKLSQDSNINSRSPQIQSLGQNNSSKYDIDNESGSPRMKLKSTNNNNNSNIHKYKQQDLKNDVKKSLFQDKHIKQQQQLQHQSLQLTSDDSVKNNSINQLKFCTKCGWKFRDNQDKFCGSCGNKRA